MPLASCPTCEKQISKKAVMCPGCGEPDPFNRQVISRVLSLVFWVAVLIGGGYVFWTYLLPMMIDFVHDM
ncbi:hypothetical protein [Vibrio rumoiensis]|uniref:Zinc ribbon domain-containing protein n=1 Tax=Vibrio rumoiensis 1S-45 TaxID=1188252 RepID=A0A1E5E4R4_9VIBR|nr:hypothetical protein [Vibrio rumoiensis]OEF27448.1 hypothetical protein A1QC_14995 [Vibrio rumoiensis 1S-45]